ncbi:MAG: hypothetical protein JNM66_27200 [Bryobacterales bacterium]|nr:hypothetical protein [Bryobacterales bacterium]
MARGTLIVSSFQNPPEADNGHSRCTVPAIQLLQKCYDQAPRLRRTGESTGEFATGRIELWHRLRVREMTLPRKN